MIRTVLLLTLVSQLGMATSLVLLPLLGLRVSDLYSLAIQSGTGSYTGLILGVLYLLAIGRSEFSYWRLFEIAGILFAAALVTVSLVVSFTSFEEIHLFDRFLIFLCFGTGGALLSSAGVVAVRETCLGRPNAMAGLTILPNFAMVIATCAIWITRDHLQISPVMPAAAWATGVGLVWLKTRLTSSSGRHIDQVSGQKSSLFASQDFVHLLALALGTISSTFIPAMYVTASGQLQAGSATILFIASKIGGSAVSLAINSYLSVRYNWRSDSQFDGRFPAYAAYSAGAALVLACFGALVDYDGSESYGLYAILLVGWMFSLVSAPLVMRVVNSRRMGSTVLVKVICDLIASSMAAFILFQRPSISGYFAAFALSQGITLFICAGSLKERALSFAAVPIVLASIFLLLYGP